MHTKRIARGAKWLDKFDIDWYKHVDINLLDNMSNTNCVLGQVTGDAGEFMRKKFLLLPFDGGRDRCFYLNLANPGTYLASIFMIRYGFITIGESNREWNEAWAYEINKRRRENILDTGITTMYIPYEWELEYRKKEFEVK